MKMNSVSIYLDDVRTPIDQRYIVVRNADEFMESVLIHKIENINEIFLDHDLSTEHYVPERLWDNYEESKRYQENCVYDEKTGYDCAKWLIELFRKDIQLPQVYTHSFNPVGADNIINIVNNAYKHFNSNLICRRNVVPFTLNNPYPQND